MQSPKSQPERADLPHHLVDIESASALIPYLREHRLIEIDETPAIEILRGGVSNRTVLVQPLAKPAFVVKQALAKLRVAVDWYSDPGRIHREALALRFLERSLLRLRSLRFSSRIWMRMSSQRRLCHVGIRIGRPCCCARGRCANMF